MIEYAEKILQDAQRDQFFVQFFVDHPEFDPSTRTRHFDWCDSHFLRYRLVTTWDSPDDDTGFYHIDFVDSDDNRLGKYCEFFEDDQGRSLSPNSYQLVQWSYQAWFEKNTASNLSLTQSILTDIL